jgi:hypothetical protein
MNEFEYYLSDRPTVYPDHRIIHEVQDLKLNYCMQLHASNWKMMNDPQGYGEYLKKVMANEIGHKMMEEGKVKIAIHDMPHLDEKVIRGEVIVMTREELYKLLGKFGVHVTLTPDMRKL